MKVSKYETFVFVNREKLNLLYITKYPKRLWEPVDDITRKKFDEFCLKEYKKTL